MKKLILSAVAIFMMASCSDDDSGSEGNNGNRLSKLTQTQYDGGQVEAVNVFEFNADELPVKSYYYDSEDNLMGYDLLEYSNGRLAEIKGFNADDEQVTHAQYIYDSQGRIVSKEHEDSGFQSVTSYTYNSDNTITVVQEGDGFTQTKTYYLNSSGLIFKEESDGYAYEVTYNGSNPVSATDNFGTTVFEYLDNPLPTGFFANNFGDTYKPNVVLRGNSLQDHATAFATKFISTETSDQVSGYEYTFNDSNRPVKQVHSRGGELQSESVYEYE